MTAAVPATNVRSGQRMAPEERAALRALAKAATRAPWRTGSAPLGVVVIEVAECAAIDEGTLDTRVYSPAAEAGTAEADAAYIAAADPDVVVRLLDAFDEAERAGGEAISAEAAAVRDLEHQLAEARVQIATLHPTAPSELYDPETDARRGDVIRSLVEPGLWVCAPDDVTDDVKWRGPLDDPTRPAAWLSSWDLPEHTVLVSRSVPVAQPVTSPQTTDETATTPTGD